MLPGVSMVDADPKTRKVTLQYVGDDKEIVSKLKEIGYPGLKE